MNIDEVRAKLAVLRKQSEEQPILCFTADIDWASEYVIESMLLFFKSAGIPLTTFVTHESKVLNKAIASKEIAAEIHPNFMPDSSQGDSFDEVIDFCFSLIPDAVCFRSHRWFAANDVHEKLYAKGIRYASNVCTNLEDIPPFLLRNRIIQFPVFFEDGGYLFDGGRLNFSSVANKFTTGGLKIINVHPMHLAVNSPDTQFGRRIRTSLTRHEWNNLDESSLKKIHHNGRGIADFINDMVEYATKKKINTVFLHDFFI